MPHRSSDCTLPDRRYPSQSGGEIGNSRRAAEEPRRPAAGAGTTRLANL